MNCDVDHCPRTAKSRGMCNTHYERWRLTGTPQPNKPIGAYGDGYLTTAGYRGLSRVGHILSDARGNVLEHRVVLFEKIGFGPHLCHWCQTPINWANRRANPNDRTLLVVDHLDSDKLNNDPSNLVPSCQLCNWERWRQGWLSERQTVSAQCN